MLHIWFDDGGCWKWTRATDSTELEKKYPDDPAQHVVRIQAIGYMKSRVVDAFSVWLNDSKQITIPVTDDPIQFWYGDTAKTIAAHLFASNV